MHDTNEGSLEILMEDNGLLHIVHDFGNHRSNSETTLWFCERDIGTSERGKRNDEQSGVPWGCAWICTVGAGALARAHIDIPACGQVENSTGGPKEASTAESNTVQVRTPLSAIAAALPNRRQQ